MTIEDNSSSGSSVDPDEFPAKRHRSSTIVTRRSKSTANLQTLATTRAVSESSHPSSINPGTETSGENVNTNDVSEVAMDSVPGTPISSLSLPSGMDTDSVRQSSPDIDVPARTTPLHDQRVGDTPSDAVTEPSPESSDTRPNTESRIPDFLTAKQDIYGYLVDVSEPRFKALLKNYITFELADRSGFRGNLPTTHRPKAVTWWSSRARPNKLPPYDSLTSFGKSIVKWWISIQPDWRRPGLTCGKTSRDEGYGNTSEDEGSCWERLYQPGVNGLLNVIIVVYWWARILEERSESADAAYNWLVSDVTWVLSQLTRVADEGFTP